MRATPIIPVKRFSAAKQRLGTEVEPADRAAVVERMLGLVFAELGGAAMLDRPIIVTGEPRAIELALHFEFDVIADREDEGHSESAMRGVEAALRRGAECVALLPGDCPEFSASEVDDLLAAVTTPSVTIVPDRHGTGTNGLILAPPDAIGPAFGEGSCERHAGLAREARVPCAVVPLESLALDIDTPEDLELWHTSS